MSLAHRLREFPVPRTSYPVDALQFMVDHGLQGKLVVSFNWAQYALASLAPHSSLQFDGRFRTCYPQEVIDMHFDFLTGEHQGRRFRSPRSGPIDPRRVLEHGTPDLVLVDRQYAHAVGVMAEEASRAEPEWVLLYRDALAELWGRSSRYDDPRSAHYFPPSERSLSTRWLTAEFEFPALPDYTLAHQRAEHAQRAEQVQPTESTAQVEPQSATPPSLN
jgi:hypothetical protein